MNFKIVDTIKKLLYKKDIYLRSPVKLQNPVQRGKVAVFESRDLEIDREQEREENYRKEHFIEL